jgi:hypothetical protein
MRVGTANNRQTSPFGFFMTVNMNVFRLRTQAGPSTSVQTPASSIEVHLTQATADSNEQQLHLAGRAWGTVMTSCFRAPACKAIVGLLHRNMNTLYPDSFHT